MEFPGVPCISVDSDCTSSTLLYDRIFHVSCKLNETVPLSCDGCGIEFRNEENLKNHIENCNVCEVTLPSNECLTEYNCNKHPELLCEEYNQYVLNIDHLEDHKKEYFKCVICRNIFFM